VLSSGTCRIFHHTIESCQRCRTIGKTRTTRRAATAD
jgi:hypothetical protein